MVHSFPRQMLYAIGVVSMTGTAQSVAVGDALVVPPTIESIGGVLDTTLTIEYATVTHAAQTLSNTRLFNGLLPGPTLVVSAGDTMNILFQNELEEQAGANLEVDNEFGIPDTANLHYHGAHVSGELPSDDVRLKVHPGQEFQYETVFPANHMPGTHWIHPHVHGSSSIHLAGGAAMALIVRDPHGYLPDLVANAPETLLMVQTMDTNLLRNIQSNAGDSKFTITDNIDGLWREFRIVNGQYQPTMTIETNQWNRWRIIHGGWLRDALDLTISGGVCEMVLLAKDGIYIQDFPRPIATVATPTGGRADVMVRCSAAGTYTVSDGFSQTVWTLQVNVGSANDANFTSWAPTLPPYLTNLQSAIVDPACRCQTSMQLTGINGVLYNGNQYIHTIKFGEVVERDLSGTNDHPYHHHVYPFQLITAIDTGYFKTGDWHDVIFVDDYAFTDFVIRFQADVHVGRIMLHCHRLNHEDVGMMAQELVDDSANATCSCDTLTASESVPELSHAPTFTSRPTSSPVATLNPTFARSDPPADTLCYSDGMTTMVRDQGAKRMDTLMPGDAVQVSATNGEGAMFSPLYSFGHLGGKRHANGYLQIDVVIERTDLNANHGKLVHTQAVALISAHAALFVIFWGLFFLSNQTILYRKKSV